MLAQLARGFHSLLFPIACMGCGSFATEAGSPVCSDCRGRLPRCPFPWNGDGRSLEGGISPFLYEGVCREMVLALKYRGRLSLAPFLAGKMAEELLRRPEHLPADRIIPVPLHPVRLRERTFNQAELLARSLSRKLDIPVESDWLIRCRATQPQTDLTREERARNVRGAFDLRGKARLKGFRILLVDDVLTTGSTAQACARLLKSAGARTVVAVTAARD